MFSFSKSTNAPAPSIRVSVSNGAITAHMGQQVTDLAGQEILVDLAGVVPIALGIRKGAAPCVILPAPGTDVVVAPQVRDVKGDALFNNGHEVPVLYKGTWYVMQFTSRGFGEGLDSAIHAAGLEEGQLLAVTVPGPDGWTAKSGTGAYGPYSYRVPQFAKPRGIDPGKVKSLEAERANREARRARAIAGQDAAVGQFVARFAAPGSVAAPAAPPPYYPPQQPQGYAPPPPQGYYAPPQQQAYSPPPQQQPAPQPARGAKGGFSGTLPKAGGNGNEPDQEF